MPGERGKKEKDASGGREGMIPSRTFPDEGIRGVGLRLPVHHREHECAVVQSRCESYANPPVWGFSDAWRVLFVRSVLRFLLKYRRIFILSHVGGAASFMEGSHVSRFLARHD
jgi:hypothetical protein